MKKRTIIILSVLAVVITAGFFLTKDTIAMVLMGEGEITLNDFEENKEALSSHDNFKDVVVEEKDGKQILSGVTADKTTTIHIVSDGNKVEQVKTVIDGSQLTEENAKSVIIKNIDGILSAVLSKKDARNIELFIGKEVIQRIKDNPEKIVIQKTFGDVEICATGDFNTGLIQISFNAK